MENSLVGDFIKKHIQRETELENIISDLKKEIEEIKKTGDNFEYFLYQDILSLIIPHLKFTYDGNNGGFYKMSMSPVPLSKEIIDQLLIDIDKYKEQHKDE